MITSITFNDVAHSRISYCKKKYLYKKKGVPIKFYPGINVLVGDNGCGKTTLINTIREYVLETNSRIPSLNTSNFEHLKLENILDDASNDRIVIKANYNYPIFSMVDYREKSGNDYDITSLLFKTEKLSAGEYRKVLFNNFFESAFNDKADTFVSPICLLKKLNNSSNDLLRKNFTIMVDYYNRHNIDEHDTMKGTFIADEPDNNLDIRQASLLLDELLNIVNLPKDEYERHQLIMVLHNPILLSGLAKCSNVHFVEMSRGFIKDVKMLSF